MNVSKLLSVFLASALFFSVLPEEKVQLEEPKNETMKKTLTMVDYIKSTAYSPAFSNVSQGLMRYILAAGCTQAVVAGGCFVYEKTGLVEKAGRLLSKNSRKKIAQILNAVVGLRLLIAMAMKDSRFTTLDLGKYLVGSGLVSALLYSEDEAMEDARETLIKLGIAS